MSPRTLPLGWRLICSPAFGTNHLLPVRSLWALVVSSPPLLLPPHSPGVLDLVSLLHAGDVNPIFWLILARGPQARLSCLGRDGGAAWRVSVGGMLPCPRLPWALPSHCATMSLLAAVALPGGSLQVGTHPLRLPEAPAQRCLPQTHAALWSPSLHDQDTCPGMEDPSPASSTVQSHSRLQVTQGWMEQGHPFPLGRGRNPPNTGQLSPSEHASCPAAGRQPHPPHCREMSLFWHFQRCLCGWRQGVGVGGRR